MIPCRDRELMLQALLDGELDAANATAIEGHLSYCLPCRSYLQTLQALRKRFAEPGLPAMAPHRLRARIRAMIAREARSRARIRRGQVRRRPSALVGAWSAAAAMAALAASLAILQLPSRGAGLEDELLANHARSLLANHLTDVAASDSHLVKPWLSGKIDFVPPVADLSDKGFLLTGARLDYAQGRAVPALVYKRGLHTINLFVLRSQTPSFQWRPFNPHPVQDVSVVRWTRNGLDFCAVSDLSGEALEQFHRAFAARSPG